MHNGRSDNGRRSSNGGRSSNGRSNGSSSSSSKSGLFPVVGRERSNSFVAEDEADDDFASISIFSVVKVKKRTVKGIKMSADYGIVINIHTHDDKDVTKKKTSYDIEFASDDHVEIRVPKKKVRLASFEKKRRKQRNKRRKEKDKELASSPQRRIKKKRRRGR